MWQKRNDYEKTRDTQIQSLKNNQRTFGETLANVIARDQTEVPKFVTKAIQYLENHGTNGPFRHLFNNTTSYHGRNFPCKWKQDASDNFKVSN